MGDKKATALGLDQGSAAGAVVCANTQQPQFTTGNIASQSPERRLAACLIEPGSGQEVQTLTAKAEAMIRETIGEPLRLPSVFTDAPYLTDTPAGEIIFAFEQAYIPDGARDGQSMDRLLNEDLPHLAPWRLEQEAERCAWLLAWNENPVALAWLRRRKAAIATERKRRKAVRDG
jgi:hypothetical protein